MGKTCYLCDSSKDDKLKFGEFMETNDISVHYYCLLLTSNLIQYGEDYEGILGFLEKDIKCEKKRILRQTCCYCNKKSANISCCDSKCRRSFHMICGLNNLCRYQFVDTFQSFCNRHHNIKTKTKHSRTEICSICYDKMGAYHPLNSIKASCCKSGWFHKACLANFAQNSGYFFKCPLCNDKDVFRNAVINMGVFIPDKDAEWELEPNAFSELLERPKNCSAEVCDCPNGREYLQGKWKHQICRDCGSSSVHIICNKNRKFYNCSECVSMITAVNQRKTIDDNKSQNQQDSDVQLNEIRRITRNVRKARDSDISDVNTDKELIGRRLTRQGRRNSEFSISKNTDDSDVDTDNESGRRLTRNSRRIFDSDSNSSSSSSMQHRSQTLRTRNKLQACDRSLDSSNSMNITTVSQSNSVDVEELTENKSTSDSYHFKEINVSDGSGCSIPLKKKRKTENIDQEPTIDTQPTKNNERREESDSNERKRRKTVEDIVKIEPDENENENKNCVKPVVLQEEKKTDFKSAPIFNFCRNKETRNEYVKRLMNLSSKSTKRKRQVKTSKSPLKGCCKKSRKIDVSKNRVIQEEPSVLTQKLIDSYFSFVTSKTI